MFTKGLKDLTNLKEGDSAHFEVHFTPADDKDIIVEWFHNGKPVPVGKHIPVAFLGQEN